MKYPLDTYLQYNVFCKTVVLEAKTKLDSAHAATNVTKVLIVIGSLLSAGVAIFVAVAALLSLGALAYFGSIGAMIATNPVLAGIVFALSLAGIGNAAYLLYQQREAVNVVKEVVIDRYQSNFKTAVDELASVEAPLPATHITTIENLANKAVIDLLNALQTRGSIDKSVLDAAVSALNSRATAR